MSLQTFDQVAMGMRICLSREHAALSREQLAECLGITLTLSAAAEDSQCKNSYCWFKS